MKRLLLFFLLVIVMPLPSFEQILSNEDDIIDRQLSRNYFYGEGTETLDSTAKAKALEILISNAQRSGVTINPKDAEYYYYFSETGGIRYIHVCAFVKKSTSRTNVSVARPVSLNESEVVISNNHAQEGKTMSTSTKPKPKEVNEHKASSPSGNGSAQPNFERTRWKQDAIEHLAKCNDLPKVLERLERMMVTMKIAEYGCYQDCKDITSVCWAIFDLNNQLVAILGEGNTSRYNYKTKKNDDLEKYINASYKVLWFSFND